MWPDEDKLKKKIFEEDESGVDVEVTILDLPKILDPKSDVGINFITELANLEEHEILDRESI